MKTDHEKQAQDFLANFNIKFRATLSDTKTPAWKADNEKSGHHYRVTLSRPHAYQLPGGTIQHRNPRLAFDFWGSIADADNDIKTVTAYDVLACISGDANCPEIFEDFCAEYGYESDSIKAMQTFRRCASFAKHLRAFFTAEELEALSEIQ